ncbi:MAG: hypothetical protein ACE5HE_08475 [Phycisphaerae bacterium]
MMRKAKTWLFVVSFAGLPLVTTATCDTPTGTAQFFSNDRPRHDHEWQILDMNIGIDHYDDGYVIYQEWEDDCFLCF